jgi:hypothetical protein
LLGEALEEHGEGELVGFEKAALEHFLEHH